MFLLLFRDKKGHSAFADTKQCGLSFNDVVISVIKVKLPKNNP